MVKQLALILVGIFLLRVTEHREEKIFAEKKEVEREVVLPTVHCQLMTEQVHTAKSLTYMKASFKNTIGLLVWVF